MGVEFLPVFLYIVFVGFVVSEHFYWFADLSVRGGDCFLKRYNPDADYFKRCGGVDIMPEKMTVWLRAHIWQQEKRQKDGSILYAQPRKFIIPWSKKTRLKDIVGYMREQGFAEDYEWAEVEPTEGMGGCTKITRDTLVKSLESSGISIRE